MVRLSLLISSILLLFLPTDNRLVLGVKSTIVTVSEMGISEKDPTEKDLTEKNLTAMEALELVKEQYAYDFIRTETGQADEYYYRLQDTGLCLAYEGGSKDEEFYFIHLYEFVEAASEPGFGHCYTYRWYSVHKSTGRITDLTN